MKDVDGILAEYRKGDLGSRPGKENRGILKRSRV